MIKHQTSKGKYQKLCGFTLVELLIIVGILIALTGMAVPAFRSFQKESDLNNLAEEIIGTLRLAQNKTLASEGKSNYGVHFETEKFVLFKGTSYNPLTTDNEIHNLPKSVEIYEINLAGDESEVVFERISGETAQTGNLNIGLIDEPDKTREICIARYIVGFCGPVSTPPPGGDLIIETRHVHFALGWSIQNATILKFDFVNEGQVETIDMADYFNGDKTKFSWKGKFIIGGAEQKYHVHTHSLDPFDTLLCIHRDGENTQALKLYIVDAGNKEIVHYQADGTGILGPYGGTFEIQ